MPKMNGRQCLTKLKTMQEVAMIPVVIYSTSKLLADESELRKMGASVFLTKPSRLVELNTIECLLNKNWELIHFKPDPFFE
jgi:CheY-like chemotaxis protein